MLLYNMKSIKVNILMYKMYKMWLCLRKTDANKHDLSKLSIILA